MNTPSTVGDAVEPGQTGHFGIPASVQCLGRLVALRTKAEADASFATVDAYIARIPQKAASTVLKCVKMVSYG